AVLVNGMGATPLSEQYIFMGDVLNELHAQGLEASFTKAGNYVTSLDMAGISLTMLALDDPQWLTYLN
ncbi:dihydroxyacetone kinase subunit DhaK, partial [Lacticaseibacillus paracasei]